MNRISRSLTRMDCQVVFRGEASCHHRIPAVWFSSPETVPSVKILIDINHLGTKAQDSYHRHVQSAHE